MLYFGRVGSSWEHCTFFGSSWGKKVITPSIFLFIFFLSYYLRSLNQVISHSIFNKLYIYINILQIEENALIDILNKKYNINIKINLINI
jgi:hypothetical protein